MGNGIIHQKSGEWQPGETLQNRYTIESVLGHGGMGVVYRIRHDAMGQTFAVKTLRTALLANPDLERMFIRELRTWMELPDHPNLMPCLFFRTISDRLAIFSEYCSGGSLKHWIHARRIDSSARVLDIAIQIAWGLDAAHTSGVIHQDIKPANILLTEDGIVRLTDFGLSRACLAGGLDSDQLHASDSTLVSSRGMTIAYCSPEQAAGMPLTRATDIWSLGVTILEMLVGDVTWPHGALAASVLEGCIEEPSDLVVPLPDALADVLRSCFRKDPAERPSSAGQLADALIDVYRVMTGQAYDRMRPVSSERDPNALEVTRRTMHGAEWRDPLEWIERAYRRLSGGAASAVSQPAARKRLTQILADLELYEEAVRIYANAMSDPDDALMDEFTELLMSRGLVRAAVRDIPGAIESYKEAVRTQEELLRRHDRISVRDELAKICFNIALLCNQTGENEQALEWNRRAVDYWERTAPSERDREGLDDVAAGYQNRALILADLGRNDEALEFMEKAAGIRESIVQADPQPQFKLTLAITFANFANFLGHVDRKKESIEKHCRAIELWEDASRDMGREDLVWHLAMLLMNRANVYSSIGEYDHALADYARALAIKEPLVIEKGLTDQNHSLAVIYMNQANTLNLKGMLVEAERSASAAVGIFERLVMREGRDDLVGSLIEVYNIWVASLERMGETIRADAVRGKADMFRKRNTHDGGRHE